jgi:hypothetical protein
MVNHQIQHFQNFKAVALSLTLCWNIFILIFISLSIDPVQGYKNTMDIEIVKKYICIYKVLQATV